MRDHKRGWLLSTILAATCFTAVICSTQYHAIARGPAEENGDAFYFRLVAEIERRDKLAIEELASLDRSVLPENHWAREWAGTYCTSIGLAGSAMRIAPKNGMVLTTHGCFGVDGGEWGTISAVHPDGLTVDVEVVEFDKPHRTVSQRLYFVRWGERQYLIPESRMLRFINNYNQGGSSRRAMFDSPERLNPGERRRDPNTPAPQDVPALPTEYAKLLMTERLDATVTNVGVPRDTSMADKLVQTQYDIELTFEPGWQPTVGSQLPLEVNYEVGLLTFEKVDGAKASGTFSVVHRADQKLELPRVGRKIVYPGRNEPVE